MKKVVWEEGKADEGIGEWVIIPVEDEDAYAQQYRKAVTLSDEIIENPIYLNWSEFKFSFDLPDQYKDGTPDRHYLYQFYLKLEIQSVYKGSKYNDTCISEMYTTLEKEF